MTKGVKFYLRVIYLEKIFCSMFLPAARIMGFGLRLLDRGGGLRLLGPEGGVSLYKYKKRLKQGTRQN